MINISGKEKMEEFIWNNYQNKKIIVIYFGAEWCGPCAKLKEKIEESIEEMPNLAICHLDIDDDENNEIFDLYRGKSIPLQVFITLDGNKIVEKKRILGYDWINFILTYKEFNEENEENKENKENNNEENEENEENEDINDDKPEIDE